MNNLKNGLGANFYLEKNLVVIGEWTDNNLQGLTINIKDNDSANKERLLIIDENKNKKEIKDEAIIIKIKESEEYINLREFYINIRDLIQNTV